MINILVEHAASMQLQVNACKTVCMMFLPKERTKIMSKTFPPFMLDGEELKFVTEFKYLGHIILHNTNDDADIDREIRNMFLELICWCVNFGNAQML